ncbi:MAG: TerB family tellurite resistance protein [Polyangiales bacterium]
MIPKCENCGARLPRLNFNCSYCNHWTADPDHPLPNPAYGVPAPAAPTPAAPPAPAAPAPVAQAPVAPPAAAPAAPAAPAPAAPAAPAVMTPMGPPVAAAVTAQEKTQPKAPAADASAVKRFGIRRTDAPAEKAAPPPEKLAAAKAAPSPEKLAAAKAAPSKVGVSKEAASSKADLFRAAVAQSGGDTWAKAKAVRMKGVDVSNASDEDDAAVAHAEAAAAAVYYVCTADDDDEMDADEYDALVDALGEMLGQDADVDALDETIARWDDDIESDWEGFLAEVAQTIGDERALRETLQLAVIAAAADGELSSVEEEAAYDVGEAFGFDEDACERIIERALRKAG